MRLNHATWREVEAYLEKSDGIIIPTGSTEQHGPMGLIGTDALCAEKIAWEASKKLNVYVAPTLAYAPAQFNMSFPGTISISTELFEALLNEVVCSLKNHGFKKFYFINGHGANLKSLKNLANQFSNITIQVKSWWDYEKVDQLRHSSFGEWEGMHATPSEISITQVNNRTIICEEALSPPKKLGHKYIQDHSGDKHGPPEQHRKRFPDGRVGSHSALATPKIGKQLIKIAAEGLISDYLTIFEN